MLTGESIVNSVPDLASTYGSDGKPRDRHGQHRLTNLQFRVQAESFKTVTDDDHEVKLRDERI